LSHKDKCLRKRKTKNICIIKEKNMSKIILAIAVIFMIMATGMVASAADDKGSVDVYVGTSANPEVVAKDISMSEKEVAKGSAVAVTTTSGKVIGGKTKEGKEYVIRAWGRSGPVSVSQGYTGWRRIYFGGSFLGSPIVTDSLNIGGNRGAIYSIGTDAGYTTTTKFDARLTAHSGSISGSYIDWVATRG